MKGGGRGGEGGGREILTFLKRGWGGGVGVGKGMIVDTSRVPLYDRNMIRISVDWVCG